MTKKALILSGLLLLSASIFIGISYSWYIDKRDAGPATADVAKIETEIYFSLQGDKGIPGETVAISTGFDNENTIRKGAGSADYIYKLTYTVTSEEGWPGVDYITDLALSGAKTDGLGLIKAEDYNAQNRRVSYFGKHVGENDLELGELLATFDKLKKTEMNKGFDIKADIEACQVTEAATSDVFNINSASDGGKYAGLFQ